MLAGLQDLEILRFRENDGDSLAMHFIRHDGGQPQEGVDAIANDPSRRRPRLQTAVVVLEPRVNSSPNILPQALIPFKGWRRSMMVPFR